MRRGAGPSLVALGLSMLLVEAAAEDRPAPPSAPSEAIAVPAGACYLRFGQEVGCVAAASQESCQRACDERLCDEITWYPKPQCWEWGWIGPSPR